MIEPSCSVDQDATDAIRAEVRAALSRPQKELPPKYFYDRRGSELFEEITRLPEYYLTRTERALLQRQMPVWVAELRPRTLVELGAGSARKTRILLEEMRRAATGIHYVPVDISEDFLAATAAELRSDYPDLHVLPLVADLEQQIALPAQLPSPALFAFLGSTVGNLQEHDAIALFGRVRAAMRSGDRFLVGADLRKDPAILEAAYNDSSGVTAEFNRNMLRALNAELGADFEPELFAHRAFYDREKHRIEMHLVSTHDQEVVIPGAGQYAFAAGETIRTEISCKYDRPTLNRMLRAAGLEMVAWATDPEELYALVLAAA